MFIATLVPDLAPFISLIGAVFYSILGLFCPAVIHLVVFWHNRGAGADGDDDSETEDDDLNCDADYYAIEEDDDDVAVQRASRRTDGVAVQRAQRRIGGGGGDGGATDNSEKGMSRWTVFKDIVIILLALIALVTGTYISLVNIMTVRPVNDATRSVMTLGLMSGSIFSWPQTWLL